MLSVLQASVAWLVCCALPLAQRSHVPCYAAAAVLMIAQRKRGMEREGVEKEVGKRFANLDSSVLLVPRLLHRLSSTL